MNKPAQLHSRLDFAQEPTPRGCWERLLRQLQLQFLLTFYPHPDSFFYPTRLRVLLAAIVVLLGTAFLGYYWWDTKHLIAHYDKGLEALAALALLVLVQVLWQPIPKLKTTWIFPVFLWFCLPVFFFLDYLWMAGRWPSLEYLCVMLLLYSNLLHWRVAALGLLTAALASALVFQLLGGQWFYPAALDIFGLALAVLGGLASSYTFGRADSLRYAQSARVVRIVGKRLEAAFGVQLALSEALRHEARESKDAEIQARLAEVVQRLDLRANLTRAKLQEIETEVGQMQIVGVKLLQVARLCPAVLRELEDAYGWSAEQLKRDVRWLEEPAGLVLQGVWMETVQLLASVLALLLRHAADAQGGAPPLLARWDQTPSGVRLSIGSQTDAAAFQTVFDAEHSKRGAAEHWAWAERLLPAYSVYIMKKMGASLQLHTTAGGRVHSLRMTWPRPDLLQNRLTGYRPLSLMQMYQDHLN